jgi:hypothetical protein
MPERELSLADGFSGVEQRLVDVFAGEVRVLGRDLLVRQGGAPYRTRSPAERFPAPWSLQVQSAVYIASMADDRNSNDMRLVVHHVDDAVVTGSDPEPSWIALKGFGTWWPRIGS